MGKSLEFIKDITISTMELLEVHGLAQPLWQHSVLKISEMVQRYQVPLL